MTGKNPIAEHHTRRKRRVHRLRSILLGLLVPMLGSVVVLMTTGLPAPERDRAAVRSKPGNRGGVAVSQFLRGGPVQPGQPSARSRRASVLRTPRTGGDWLHLAAELAANVAAVLGTVALMLAWADLHAGRARVDGTHARIRQSPAAMQATPAPQAPATTRLPQR